MRKIYCKECGKYLFTEKRFLEFGGVALCPQCVEKYKFFVVAVDHSDPRHPGSLRCPITTLSYRNNTSQAEQ